MSRVTSAAIVGCGITIAFAQESDNFSGVTTYFSENFDSLIDDPGLLPFPSEPHGDGTDWLDLPTAQEADALLGWHMIKNASHGKGGVTEWSGWTFASPEAWAAAAPGQQREKFALGTNVIAIADSDEFDDVAGGRPFDATLRTPLIDISKADPMSLTLKFDSGWQAESQTGTILVTYDDEEAVEILRFDEGKSTAFSETVRVALKNPRGARTMRIEWRKVGSNNWWWVIDNIEVNDEQPANFSIQPRIAFPSPDVATISWQAPAQKAILYYGEGKEGTLSHKVELESSDGRFDVELAALRRATTYRYRIALIANKRRRLSEMFEFDTRFNLSPSPVTVLESHTPDTEALVTTALEATADQNGYILILGLKDGALASALAARSRFHIIAADADPAVIQKVRQKLYKNGSLGHRISVVSLEKNKQTPWTDGFADLILSEKNTLPVSTPECLRLLRPDGGTFLASSPKNPEFDDAPGQWEKEGSFSLFRRGELPGARNWTHQ